VGGWEDGEVRDYFWYHLLWEVVVVGMLLLCCW
jgi:hypothetical protein